MKPSVIGISRDYNCFRLNCFLNHIPVPLRGERTKSLAEALATGFGDVEGIRDPHKVSVEWWEQDSDLEGFMRQRGRGSEGSCS